MARNKRRLLKRRRSDRDELTELLSGPLSVEFYRRQLAWEKQERLRYGRRTYTNDDGYIAWLEQGAGVALEDAEDSWLTGECE